MMENKLVTEARKAFGGRLKALRLSRNLTLNDLERRSGIRYSAIAAMESGSRPAGVRIAAALADALLLKDLERDLFLAEASSTLSCNANTEFALSLGTQLIDKLQLAGLPLTKIREVRIKNLSTKMGNKGLVSPARSTPDYQLTVGF
jgi:transcriptional regulator with XRE-family HTH domain